MSIKSGLDPKRWSAVPENPRQQDAKYLHFAYYQKADHVGWINTGMVHYFESYNWDAHKDWDTTPSNRLQARDVVLAYNHPHSRKNKRNPHFLREANRDYLLSLEMFNLCRNCQRPIRVKTAKIRRDATVKYQSVHYAEIPEHFEVYHDGEDKVKMRLVPTHTVENVRCECPMREQRKLERSGDRPKPWTML